MPTHFKPNPYTVTSVIVAVLVALMQAPFAFSRDGTVLFVEHAPVFAPPQSAPGVSVEVAVPELLGALLGFALIGYLVGVGLAYATRPADAKQSV